MDYPDIFFTPEYQGLFKDTAFGGEPEHFFYGGIDYRFYKRPIEGTDYFDIVSPYGYSGPVAIGDNAKQYISVWLGWLDMFHQLCYESNIIAEFARMHPFILQYLDKQRFSSIAPNGEVVYIDLTRPLEFDKGCKSSIKKAQNTKMTISTDPNPILFYRLYTETMMRNRAEGDYLFSLSFFEQLLKLQGAKQYSAWYNGQMIASIIVLICGDYAHYFLAGSSTEYRHLCPSNLLLATAIEDAKKYGCKIFNLGGAKDEKHMIFKRSFSKLTKPFFTYRKIHNPNVYSRLCGNLNTQGFFPAYRRGLKWKS